MSWPFEELGNFVNIKTGRLDANAADVDGKYPFFTCSREPLRINTEAFDCNAILVAGNGDLNVKHYNGKFNAYQRTYVITTLDEKILDTRFLFHFMERYVERLRELSIGGVIKYIKLGMLTEAKIPLPPLDEQKRIAAILDKADAIRRKRQKAIQLADDFLRAVFLDMFGDPVTNPKGWPTKLLSEVGLFKNGMNYGKEEFGETIHCLGVGDFKGLDRIDDVSLLSKINLNALPNSDYLLKDGDLVFVRSNGNKALVGRCLIVYPGDNPLTFSGFCIRLRINSEEVISDYMNYFFRMPSLKHKLLAGGQGANIQNINQKRLSEIEVPVPPMQLQDKFANMVRAFKSSQKKCFDSVEQKEKLFSSVSQKAFAGNL